MDRDRPELRNERMDQLDAQKPRSDGTRSSRVSRGTTTGAFEQTLGYLKKATVLHAWHDLCCEGLTSNGREPPPLPQDGHALATFLKNGLCASPLQGPLLVLPIPLAGKLVVSDS